MHLQQCPLAHQIGPCAVLVDGGHQGQALVAEQLDGPVLQEGHAAVIGGGYLAAALEADRH